MGWGRKCLLDFSAGKTQLILFDWFNNISAINVKMDGSVLGKNLLLGCWCCLSLLYWNGALTLSKTASKKIGTLIHSMKFPSLEVCSVSI